MKIKEFLGEKAKYHVHGEQIFAVNKKGEHQIILEVRGWGAIQNLFKLKKGKIDFEKAENFQDELGEWVADAINQKLNNSPPHPPPPPPVRIEKEGGWMLDMIGKLFKRR